MTPPKYKVGDEVIWADSQGVVVGMRKITEVMKQDDGPQRYRITHDTPWMYVREVDLAPNLESMPDGWGAFGTNAE
jgi:hypothetical protein